MYTPEELVDNQSKKTISISRLSLGMSCPTETIEIVENMHQDKTLISDKVSYVWKLPTTSIQSRVTNPPAQTNSKTRFLSSEKIQVGGKLTRTSEWRMQLNPAYQYGSTSFVSLYLWLQKGSPGNEFSFVQGNTAREGATFRCIYQFDIVNDDGKSFYEKHSGIRRFRLGDCYGWPTFISQPEFQKIIADNKSIAISIQLQLTILAIEDGLTSPGPQTDEFLQKNKTNKSKRKHGDPYRHTKIDVMCRAATIRLNKSTLAERSPVFHNMILENDTNPNGNPNCIYVDEDTQAFKLMLAYFYRRKIGVFESKSLEEKHSLLKLALKYKVDDLATSILNLAFKNVTIDSATEIALIALDTMGFASTLKSFQHFKTFFLKNRTTIRETEKFMKNYDTLKIFLVSMLV